MQHLNFSSLMDLHQSTKYLSSNTIARHMNDYLSYCESYRKFDTDFSYEVPRLYMQKSLQKLGDQPIKAQALLNFIGCALGKRTSERSFHGMPARAFASAGNFQPLSVYMVTNVLSSKNSLQAFHFVAAESKLELIQDYQFSVEDPVSYLCLTSFPYKSEVKYQGRAWRFSQIDLGHAIASIELNLSVLGWSAMVDTSLTQEELADVLGIKHMMNRDPEVPALLLQIRHGKVTRSLSEFKTNMCAKQYELPVLSPRSTSCHQFKTRSLLYDQKLSGEIGNQEQISMLTLAEVQSLLVDRVSTREMSLLNPVSYEQGMNFLKDLMSVQSPFEKESSLLEKTHLAFCIRNTVDIHDGLYFLLRDKSLIGYFKSLYKPQLRWNLIREVEASSLYFLSELPDSYWAQLAFGGSHAQDYSFMIYSISRFESVLKKQGVCAYPQILRDAGFMGQWVYWLAQKNALGACGVGGFVDDQVQSILFGNVGSATQIVSAYSVGLK